MTVRTKRLETERESMNLRASQRTTTGPLFFWVKRSNSAVSEVLNMGLIFVILRAYAGHSCIRPALQIADVAVGVLLCLSLYTPFVWLSSSRRDSRYALYGYYFMCGGFVIASASAVLTVRQLGRCVASFELEENVLNMKSLIGAFEDHVDDIVQLSLFPIVTILFVCGPYLWDKLLARRIRVLHKVDGLAYFVTLLALVAAAVVFQMSLSRSPLYYYAFTPRMDETVPIADADHVVGVSDDRNARKDHQWFFDDMSALHRKFRSQLEGEGVSLRGEQLEDVSDVVDGGYNVIVLILESVRSHSMHYMNDSLKYTHPFVASRNSSNSVRFLGHYGTVPNSQCAQFSIFCGQFPLRHVSACRHQLQRCRRLPEVFRSKGVRTGYWLSDVYDNFVPSSFYDDLKFDHVTDPSAVEKGRRQRDVPVERFKGRLLERETATEVIEWSKARCANDDQFLGVHYTFVNHDPYYRRLGAAYVSAQDSDRQRYERLYRVFDNTLRQYSESLRHCGRPVVLVPLADHGEGFEEHEGNRYHADYVFQENMHVPFYVISVTSPALSFPDIHATTSHVDFASTVLHLMLGKKALDQELASQKLSLGLLPWLGDSLFRKRETAPALIAASTPGLPSGITFAGLKLIKSADGMQLFNVSRDPWERNNIAEQYPRLVDIYSSWMDGMLGLIQELKSHVDK